MEAGILLRTQGLNERLLKMEERLTVILDSVNLLLQEEEQLKRVWQGPAQEQWSLFFEQQIQKINAGIREVKKLVVLFRIAAQDLSDMERRLYSGIERD